MAFIDISSGLICLTNISLTPAMERAVATHSSALAWKIPWTEEPGGLHSMELLGVGHD